MKVLALEKEVAGVAGERFTGELLRAEAAKAWELYRSGALPELYFRAGRNEAVLVLEYAGLDEALQTLRELPLVRAGLIDFDLIPLQPYPGFSRLFATG